MKPSATYFDDINPREFSDEDFARSCAAYFDKYIEWRVEGYTPQIATGRVFGTEMKPGRAYHMSEALESNPYVTRGIKRGIDKLSERKVWDLNKSVHKLLTIANDPEQSAGSRLAAMKELNIMHGITVVDEEGNTKPGKSLEDFYSAMPIAGESNGQGHSETGPDVSAYPKRTKGP